MIYQVSIQLKIHTANLLYMKIFKITREWKVDAKNCTSYFQSVLSVCGIPLLSTRRTSTRVLYLFGIPIYKQRLRKQSAVEGVMHLLRATVNVYDMPQASGILRTFQQAELEFLKKVDSVCKKHNICYWLDFGTLLGAVRHKGFIPWDDDVDIAMLRPDYEKFLSVCKSEFPEERFSFNSMGFLQIHLKGTMLQVDVFPYDRAADTWFPEGEIESEFNRRVYRATSKLKFDVDLHRDQEDCIVNYTYEQRRKLHKCEVLQGREELLDGNIFLALDVPASKRFTYKDEWIYPLRNLEFEGVSLPCPNMSELVLYTNYGDWGEVPKNPYRHFNLREIGKRDYLKLLEIVRDGL